MFYLLFCFSTSFHLNAVDLDTVGALSGWDAVLNLYSRQEVPPERSVTRLKHPHVRAVGSKAHLEDNYKHHPINYSISWQSINHLEQHLFKFKNTAYIANMKQTASFAAFSDLINTLLLIQIKKGEYTVFSLKPACCSPGRRWRCPRVQLQCTL